MCRHLKIVGRIACFTISSGYQPPLATVATQPTAWLDLRNKAAHAQYGEYNHDQVQNLLIGVREFAARIAA